MRDIKSHTIYSTTELDLIYDEPVLNELHDWPYSNHFFSYFKRESTRLVVMLQGGIDREKVPLPVFQRWSWSEEIKGSVLILNDPTLFGNQLILGWWQGEESSYALSSACDFIRLIIGKLGYSIQDVLFYGSSAGGFSALMMAGHLGCGLAIVNNPQINLLERHIEQPFQAVLETKFRGISREEAFNEYPTRFSVSALFKEINYIPRILYYQNVKDHLHFEGQYLPFVKELYGSGLDPNEFQSVLYMHHWGHFPLERIKTISIINLSIAELSGCNDRMKLKEIPEVFESVNVPITLTNID
uniref:Uncharacterized protein n=1 Tax=Candidatus Kentrum sp. UNK TaxID=2126344 RepID=A0A451APG7_9GAMM|nr:MAG: hypothetical protein BECKUNK1418G_GA0071005_11736 [Candidatus Kentron sp. UNK]VFK73178.1 MAG: hypothetical protein BECKUNK1418H_GA0071006_11706 [Candidatus Kentron sp. UNK]